MTTSMRASLPVNQTDSRAVVISTKPAPMQKWKDCPERDVDIFEITRTAPPAGAKDSFLVSQCRAIPESNLPPVDHDYIFTQKNLFNMWLWLNTQRPLLLFGEPGIGKSTLVEQIAARLLTPVFSLTCSSRTEIIDLIGSRTLHDANSGFDYGPLTRAYRDGGWFLLDEVDALDPGIANGLYPFLERRPLTIPETGDVFKAHPRFRLVATANTNGLMDETGLHLASQRQSIAHMDRYMKVRAEHFSKAEEFKVLRNKIADLDDETLLRMIDVAWDIRAANMNSRAATQLDITCSPRSVIAWAELWSKAKRLNTCKVNVPIYTLNIAFANLASTVTKEAIAKIVGAYFPLDSYTETLD